MKVTRWENYFLDMAYQCALMSKDPNTKVGVVIVGPDNEIRSTGFNGFPRGIKDTEERLNDKEIKNGLVIHAEHNAILNAARIGVSIKGCTLYLVATDDSGQVWSGPPCIACGLTCIQAGISRIVGWPFKDGPSSWRENTVKSQELLMEAGVVYNEVERLG